MDNTSVHQLFSRCPTMRAPNKLAPSKLGQPILGQEVCVRVFLFSTRYHESAGYQAHLQVGYRLSGIFQRKFELPVLPQHAARVLHQ